VESPDPWTYFLNWLTTVLVPDWTELVNMLPFWILLGVVGPIFTILALAWTWHVITDRHPRVNVADTEPQLAALDAGGAPLFPANVPYCAEHGLVFPPSAVRCTVDNADLSVRCPVDGTVRDASIQMCTACGTRYVLGAASTSVMVRRPAGPPPGGAAVA
jgi:hypothetical protein